MNNTYKQRYRVSRKFQKSGSAGYRVPKKFQKLGYQPEKKLDIDGYGVLARKKFWVPMGTGYRRDQNFWVPMDTGYQPDKNCWVLMGTGYQPEKIFWGPMSTGYRPEKFFWVPTGTGYRPTKKMCTFFLKDENLSRTFFRKGQKFFKAWLNEILEADTFFLQSTANDIELLYRLYTVRKKEFLDESSRGGKGKTIKK